MYDNYNYPMGADTPNAPWNETSIPERDFDIEARATMRMSSTITTNDYNPINDDECGYVEIDTFDTDWNGAFYREYYGIEKLLEMLKEYATKDLENVKGDAFKTRRLKGIIEECDLWHCEDLEIEEQ